MCSVTIFCIYGAILCLTNFFVSGYVNYSGSKQKGFLPYIWISIQYGVVNILLAGFAGMMGLSVSGLTFFHTYLICSGKTTYEHIKKLYKDKQNPFHKGFIKNYINIFCTKDHPSKLILHYQTINEARHTDV